MVWILFDCVLIFILTTTPHLPAYNTPTCLAKVSDLKVDPNDRKSHDFTGFFTKIHDFSPFFLLNIEFTCRKKKYFAFYAKLTVQIVYWHHYVHESTIKSVSQIYSTRTGLYNLKKCHFVHSKGNMKSAQFLRGTYLRNA